MFLILKGSLYLKVIIRLEILMILLLLVLGKLIISEGIFYNVLMIVYLRIQRNLWEI